MLFGSLATDQANQRARAANSRRRPAKGGRGGTEGRALGQHTGGQDAQFPGVHCGWALQVWPGQRSLAVTGSQGICCHLVAVLLQLRRQGL